MKNKIILGAFIFGSIVFATIGTTQNNEPINTLKNQVIRYETQPIHVKYRGIVDVDNGHFEHLNIGSSSYVNNMFYDDGNQYLLVQLKNTYYHYCSITSSIIYSWIDSSSLGRYYNQNIKGNYSCQNNPVPQY